MAASGSKQRATDNAGFKQQDASAWISFDPEVTGHRKDVRSAAAKSSAAARKATIARKLALNTDCTTPESQGTTSSAKRRRREQKDGSPVSATSSALPSRGQSEISLTPLASTNSSMSSGTTSPYLVQTPQLSLATLQDSPPAICAQASPPSVPVEHAALQRAVTFVLGADTGFSQEWAGKEPTHFGASRVKSRVISIIHDAIGARRAGSSTLLGVALLAAWDLRFGSETSSLMHLRAWHHLALPQNVLPVHNGSPPPNLTITEAVLLSLQRHLPAGAYSDTKCLLDQTTPQLWPRRAASGWEIISFFDTVGELVGVTSTP